MELVYGLILLLLVSGFVAVPFFRERSPEAGEDPVLADLEARKEAKYREIRDLDLDRDSGKLELAEYERQRGELRRDAAEILRQLDAEKSRKRATP